MCFTEFARGRCEPKKEYECMVLAMLSRQLADPCHHSASEVRWIEPGSS